jgi:hypothetical protein
MPQSEEHDEELSKRQMMFLDKWRVEFIKQKGMNTDARDFYNVLYILFGLFKLTVGACTSTSAFTTVKYTVDNTDTSIPILFTIGVSIGVISALSAIQDFINFGALKQLAGTNAVRYTKLISKIELALVLNNDGEDAKFNLLIDDIAKEYTEVMSSEVSMPPHIKKRYSKFESEYYDYIDIIVNDDGNENAPGSNEHPLNEKTEVQLEFERRLKKTRSLAMTTVV